jgi:hypothetical protein
MLARQSNVNRRLLFTMAKRHRGSHRPGGRRADRSGSRHQPRPAYRPAQGLTAAEEAHAAELESEILDQERTAQVARAREDRVAALEGPAPRPGSPLAVRAAAEYAYVSRDVRRILRIGGSMLVILSAVFVLVRVLHVVNI